MAASLADRELIGLAEQAKVQAETVYDELRTIGRAALLQQYQAAIDLLEEQ